MPSTEKKGRRHSSDVKVVWLSQSAKPSFTLAEKDLQEEFVRTTGPGGQHRNKVSTGVRLTHLPSGLQVVADGRSQASNRKEARERLAEVLAGANVQEAAEQETTSRVEQLALSREWVWTEWRDSVKAPSGRKYSFKRLLKGDFAQVLKKQ